MVLDAGLIPFSFPGVPSARCFFSGASFGNINLDLGLIGNAEAEKKLAVQRREAALKAAGAHAWTELKQVHGEDFIFEPLPTPLNESSSLEGDGACTSKKGHALIIKTADCQPILLVDKSGQYAAALHVGWRGNRIGFPRKGTLKFCLAYDLEMEDILAVRGPSLGPGAAEFRNFEAEWGPEFKPWLDEQTMNMDLWSLTREQLIKAGLPPQNIYALDLCTASLPGYFYSFRRGDGARQLSLICL